MRINDNTDHSEAPSDTQAAMTNNPARMLTPTELAHFVAAQELLTKGAMAADTVELLCFFAPRPITMIAPDPTTAGRTKVTASVVGAGRAWNGEWDVDTLQDAKSMGRKSEEILEGGSVVIAQQVKRHLQNIQRQITAGIHKKVRSALDSVAKANAELKEGKSE